MKLFAFIMAIIVLAVSCVPCMDDDVALKADKHKTEPAKSHNGPHQDQTDNCSPFCICSCCAGVLLYSSVIEPGIIISTRITQFSVQHTASVTDVSLPVWQPPQLFV